MSGSKGKKSWSKSKREAKTSNAVFVTPGELKKI